MPRLTLRLIVVGGVFAVLLFGHHFLLVVRGHRKPLPGALSLSLFLENAAPTVGL